MKIIYYITLFTLVVVNQLQNQEEEKVKQKEKIVEIDSRNKYWDSICKLETKKLKRLLGK
jgi:hypothetical protein